MVCQTRGRLLFLFLLSAALAGCNSVPKENYPDLEDFVNLERFMGTWYVHGCTTTFLDRDPYNATETYEWDGKGRILTTYRFRKGGFDGPEKIFRPVGKVVNQETNAEWSMRFFSLFSGPYLILHVDSDYRHTLVGHPNRKMSWLMSRSPEMSEEKFEALKQKLSDQGYALEEFVRIPQKWPET